ncbi:MAG: AraC family transcriptional regulator [Acidobacteriota bacterium]|nr:AraC family transcriptional regulator [Acidobacteriota bacterium]
MSLICVDEHVNSNPAEPLPVGRNFFSTVVVRPGSQSMTARLSLWFCLQDGYKIVTDRGHYDITPTTFVVLNEGQRFELTAEPGTAPRAASLIFDQQYVADIARSFSAPLTAALEVDREGLVVRFPECIQHETGFEIGPKLRSLAAACARGDAPEVLAERFRAATECLVLVYSAATRQIDSIDSVRPGTRAELYRRIQRAYVYIQDNYTDELCLEKIARAACMSPHHFHRVFSQVYGITPLRALADRRMQMAHKLLETTDTPVSAICRAVGYHSAPTFSNLFRAKFGVPPSLLQQRSRRVRMQYAS